MVHQKVKAFFLPLPSLTLKLCTSYVLFGHTLRLLDAEIIWSENLNHCFFIGDYEFSAVVIYHPFHLRERLRQRLIRRLDECYHDTYPDTNQEGVKELQPEAVPKNNYISYLLSPMVRFHFTLR